VLLLAALAIALAVPSGAAPRGASELARMLNRPRRTCGTPEPVPADLERARSAMQLRASSGRTAARGGVIAVAVHVITSGGEGEVTERQIADQIRTLNQGYSGTGFRFLLASVDRTENKAWFKMQPGTGAEKQAKEALAINPAHRLNLYTCSPGKSLLGWSYFPWSIPEGHFLHGVVVEFRTLPGGSLAPYDLGGTAVHETGHYLGLLHTFQGGCVAPGDEVDDTPFEASPAFGCPEGRNSCPQPGDDPIHDYMDYTDDVCYTEFTSGQTARMQALVPLYRPSLLGGAVALAGARGEAEGLDAALDRARALPGLIASPNPFHAFTTLRFSLPQSEHVTLEVFDVAGHRVGKLIDADLPAGDHSAMLGGDHLSPGMYFVSLQAGEQRLRRSVVLMR
jgi:hypothetical protein